MNQKEFLVTYANTREKCSNDSFVVIRVKREKVLEIRNKALNCEYL